MPRQSRKKSTGESVYCRKCQSTLPKHKFYSALDTVLDANGLMSVCKDCCTNIFVSNLNTEVDVFKAVYNTCKILNIAYVPQAIDSALLQLDSKKEEGMEINFEAVFGTYKSKLANYLRIYPDQSPIFEGNTGNVEFNEDDAALIREREGEEFAQYLKNTWGNNLSIEEYNFLEDSLDKWKATHKCDTNAELVLMQEICQVQLKIRNARENGDDTKALLKLLQDVIKTANLSPAQADMTNASKGNEVFGMWIKDIEELEPAEWWDSRRDALWDLDNISQYFEDFVTRPIKNFLTRTRDFVVKSFGGDGKDFEVELKEIEEDEELD